MLIAHSENGFRTPARSADRAAAYFCPACAETVVLRRGLIKIPHFAHRPRAACHFGAGESVSRQKNLFQARTYVEERASPCEG